MASADIPPKKQQITFGKFQNVDLRVARVIKAGVAEGTAAPCRVIELDLGPLGTLTSVGQYALIAEEDLIGKKVIVCVNMGEREMGPYVSQALVLGARHPESPDDQAQATPLFVRDDVQPGAPIY